MSRRERGAWRRLRTPALALGVGAALVTGTGVAPAAAATVSTGGAATVRAAATPVFHFGDPRIDESSGLAAATRERGVFFTHNDSGDTARFFAVGTSGRTLMTYDVGGVTAVDWEDMATAPGPDGVPSVWLADIGDNGANRASVAVYVVHEPKLDTEGVSGVRAARVVATYRLRYPDRPHDAETLLVDPKTRHAFVVTKAISGRSEVYALPARPTGDAVATMRHVGSIAFVLTDSGGGPIGPLGALTATGGDVAPGGRLLAIRTYTDTYVWQVGSGGVLAALRHPPRWRLPAPQQPQGEGVTFSPNGGRLLFSSEGVGSTVYAEQLPKAPAPSGSATAAGDEPASSRSTTGGTSTAAIGLGVVAVLVVGVIGVALALRTRRRSA